MIRLGGHGVGVAASGDPLEIALAHKAFGYGAAYCPLVELSDRSRLQAIEQAFGDQDVMLAEIGIWRNLLAVEPTERAKNIAEAIEKLAIADEVGVKCAVTYIGSYASDGNNWPDPKNLGDVAFDETVEITRQVIDAVKPKRAKFALEMMQYALPDSVESYLDLIRAIDRPSFGAHLDPVNLIMTPRTYFENGKLIRDCFEKLGQWIVSCHGKDIVLHHHAALHLDEVMIGDGVLDYRTYLEELDRLPRDVPLMLEHLEDAEYALARDRIFAVGDAVGVAFHGRAGGN